MSLSKVYKTSEVIFEPKPLIESTVPQEPQLPKEEFPPPPPVTPEPEPPVATSVPEETSQPEPVETGIPKEEVARLTAEARQQGFSEGQHQAEAEFHATVTTLRLLCGQLEELRETLLGKSKTELCDLVMAIAEKVIHQSIAEQDKTMVRTVEEALSRALKADTIEIRVNPHDYDILEKNAAELIPGINALTHVFFKADARIAQGGCHLEADTCTVDATIASQLEIIRKELQRSEE